MPQENSLLILYATVTGTAEDIAYTLQRRLEGKVFPFCRISSIDTYDFKNCLPDENYVIFIVSTTGDGDPPMSMKGKP